MYRVWNSLICLSLICSFVQIAQIKWATVSNSLRLLRTNEHLWANRSGCSSQKSDCERIAQIAHDKWATVNNLHRLLMINEQMSISLIFLSESLVRSFALSLTKNERFAQTNLTKMAFFGKFFVSFFLYKKDQFSHSLFLMSNESESLWLLTKNERCERIAQVAQQKWATMSELLWSLTKNERISESLLF